MNKQHISSTWEHLCKNGTNNREIMELMGTD